MPNLSDLFSAGGFLKWDGAGNTDADYTSQAASDLAADAAFTGAFAPPVLDEDNMATDSALRPPSQQSVKAYVDARERRLAETILDAASQVDKDATGTAATFDAGATVSFTIPASGIVIAELEAKIRVDGDTSLVWDLHNGTTQVPGSEIGIHYSSVTNQRELRGHYLRKFTGLTPGAVTWTWRVRRTFGSATARTSYGAAAGAARMSISIP